jgi:hypothetical protein
MVSDGHPTRRSGSRQERVEKRVKRFFCARTFSFYDDAKTVALPLTTTIKVDGESANPGKIDMTALPFRSVIVKETVLRDSLR